MKFVAGLLIFLALGVFGYIAISPSGPAGQETSQTQAVTENKPNPLSIEALAQTDIPEGKLTVEKTVEKRPGFTSYTVSFTVESLKEYALMNVPTGQMPEGGWPVVVVNHGYIDPKVYSTEKSYINTSAYFADAGFLVLKPDYRGNARSEGGAGGIESRIKYATDVLYLMGCIPNLETANADRIYMYGHSMGGDVTLRVLETTDKVKAATLWAPAVTDWPESFLYFSRRGDASRSAGLKQELDSLASPEEYKNISTLENINRVNVPVNIQHGTADLSVPYSWGEQLAAKLKAAGKSVNFYSWPGDTHDIPGHWGQALARDVALFRERT